MKLFTWCEVYIRTYCWRLTYFVAAELIMEHAHMQTGLLLN